MIYGRASHWTMEIMEIRDSGTVRGISESGTESIRFSSWELEHGVFAIRGLGREFRGLGHEFRGLNNYVAT